MMYHDVPYLTETYRRTELQIWIQKNHNDPHFGGFVIVFVKYVLLYFTNQGQAQGTTIASEGVIYKI